MFFSSRVRSESSRCAAGAALTVVVLLAGCSEAEGPQVATAQQPTVPGASVPAPAKAGGSAAPAGDSDYDKALGYTRCMNDHGSELPDPVVGKALPTGYEIPPNKHKGASEELLVRIRAYQACKRLLPATWPIKMDPKDIVRDKPFSDCVLKKGVAVATPGPDGIVHEPTDPKIYQTPEYRAAEASCRHLVDDPAMRQQQD